VSVAPFWLARPLSNYLQTSSRDRRLHTAYRSNARRLVCSKPCSERNSILEYDRLLGQNEQMWFLYISPPETYSNEQSSVIPQRRIVGEHLFCPVSNDNKIEIQMKILVNHLISRVMLPAALLFTHTTCSL